MPVESKVIDDTGEIILSGNLTFADSGEFRKQLNQLLDKKLRALAVRLDTLTFMDSSGLGMLMVTHNECQSHGMGLTLHHPRGDVKALLEMTKSYDRFTIIDG